MGKSDRILLTYNVNMEQLARVTLSHISTTIKRIVVEDDHQLVEDNQKIASRETKEKIQKVYNEYMSGISAEWFQTEADDVKSVSTMTRALGLERVSTTLSFRNEIFTHRWIVLN